ncbi:class I SAM-dependent methyltransferase [Halocatena pleomorpha]|uniref:Class I SAM-dependent methyltransferase n=1 Tax=Halocatena pleomorpha TaxID=1785090 RepID=A0A3P3RL32_9EURY|nr:class I SAM-dependent methyltransferase [Halocatena pleomorpha]RRJ34085.1 class I SAM-dependent methyltransferase [Halocatena pleomorpha]
MSEKSFNEWEEIAQLYDKQQSDFGRVVKRNFRTINDRFEFTGDDLLDIACGDGEFVAFAAKQGYTVTGVDKSSEMLRLAEERFTKEAVDSTLYQYDMRELPFSKEFDIITCWYNSVNYLCKLKDLRTAFETVYRSLRPEGIFVFDFVNRKRLREFATSPALVPHDTDDLFEVHHDITYDTTEDLLSVEITGFIADGDVWERIDETHKNRGYRIEEVRSSLKQAGFDSVTAWEDIRTKTSATESSKRIWTIAKK